MVAQGQMQAAVEYLDKKAAECVEEGESISAITIFNELEGFWRVAGDKEKSYAAAEAALGLISSGAMEGSIGHATTLLNYATAKRPSERLKMLLSFMNGWKRYMTGSFLKTITATQACTTTWPSPFCV